MRPLDVIAAEFLVGAAVGDVEGLLVGGERQPVGLVETVRHDQRPAGCRVVAVHVVPDLRFGSETLQVAITRVGEPDGAVAATTTSFGEFSRSPPQASTTLSSSPVVGCTRLILARSARVPCSQTTRRPLRSDVIPLAAFTSATSTDTSSGSSSGRRLICTDGEPSTPSRGSVVKYRAFSSAKYTGPLWASTSASSDRRGLAPVTSSKPGAYATNSVSRAAVITRPFLSPCRPPRRR